MQRQTFQAYYGAGAAALAANASWGAATLTAALKQWLPPALASVNITVDNLSGTIITTSLMYATGWQIVAFCVQQTVLAVISPQL